MLLNSFVEEVRIVEKMTLEEKVGQIIMVHFHGEMANEDSRILIQDVNVGGIVYYNWANQLHSPDQVKTLSEGLQSQASENRISVPLLIATDQEGSRVARLRNGFTVLPDNADLGKLGDPSLAEKFAYIAGCELLDVGVNMNFAPVIDVNNNPQNPVIGVRSYGDNPKIVAQFGEMALKGYARAGIIAVLKHFPGHGDVSVDSHYNLPVVDKSIEELETCELLPFRKLACRAPAIMTAHLLVSALDEENCSTLSKKTISYLKNDIGFQGLVISDSLVMGALNNYGTIDEVAISALNAGCDLLLLGGMDLLETKEGVELGIPDVQRIHRTLVTAVKTCRIAAERLDDAVTKILRIKMGQ